MSTELNSNGIPVVREKIINRIVKDDKPTHNINQPITSLYKTKAQKKKAKPKVIRSKEVEKIEPNSKLARGYEDIAREINDFTYEGRPKRSPKKLHTVAEHEAFLKKILEKCWDIHNKDVISAICTKKSEA